MRAAAAATDKYVLDFCLPGRILRMGGECHSICRSTDRSFTYITIQASFFRRFYLLPFARPPSTDSSREILDNFFFAEIRHPRDGYFPMEVERTRYREEVW